MVHSENLLRKREKQDKYDRLTLVLTYNPALNKVYDVLKKAHGHTIRSPRLSAVLQSPLRVPFRNPNTVKDTAQKMKFFIKDFFSKCDQICSFLQIWSHYLRNPWWKTSFFVHWDHLVRSKLKIRDSNDEENGIYKCGNINCDICNVLYLINEFQSTVTGKRYHIIFKFDCKSINVIYSLSCKRCRKQYVGSTFAKFSLRFKKYESNIKRWFK